MHTNAKQLGQQKHRAVSCGPPKIWEVLVGSTTWPQAVSAVLRECCQRDGLVIYDKMGQIVLDDIRDKFKRPEADGSVGGLFSNVFKAWKYSTNFPWFMDQDMVPGSDLGWSILWFTSSSWLFEQKLVWPSQADLLPILPIHRKKKQRRSRSFKKPQVAFLDVLWTEVGGFLPSILWLFGQITSVQKAHWMGIFQNLLASNLRIHPSRGYPEETAPPVFLHDTEGPAPQSAGDVFFDIPAVQVVGTAMILTMVLSKLLWFRLEILGDVHGSIGGLLRTAG